MKAAVVASAGQVPQYLDFADPTPATGEFLVSVAAAAITPIARARASGGHYSSTGQFPLIPGVEGVGRLDDGRRIFFFMPRAPYGAFAERTVVPQKAVIPLSDDLDDVTAAAIGNPGVSSWAALTDRAGFRPGQTVFINGATGISGQLAVQVAKHLGAAKVIASGRNRDALTLLPELGADVVIPLVEDDDALETSLKPAFAEGVDIVLDYLWGRSARVALIAAARAGKEQAPMRFVSIGSIAGAEMSLPSAVLRSTSIELLGSGLGSVSPDRLISSISAFLEAAAESHFRIGVRSMPLTHVAEAWNAADDGQRVVLVPGGAAI